MRKRRARPMSNVSEARRASGFAAVASLAVSDEATAGNPRACPMRRRLCPMSAAPRTCIAATNSAVAELGNVRCPHTFREKTNPLLRGDQDQALGESTTGAVVVKVNSRAPRFRLRAVIVLQPDA